MLIGWGVVVEVLVLVGLRFRGVEGIFEEVVLVFKSFVEIVLIFVRVGIVGGGRICLL